MSSIETIDKTIEVLIEKLVKEFGGMFATDERKAQIIKDIAKLRASMSPQCNCQK